jgi:3-phenylpropionate/trans-cinnamate dioxygenase ferredoxin reductase subunit
MTLTPASPHPRRVVIVGAGHGGANTAALLRQQGFEGEIVLVGAESSSPYQRPPLSKAYLKGAMTDEALLIKPAGFYAEQRIETRWGTSVTALDPTSRTVTLANGASLTYDALVLATGAVPRRLSIDGADLTGVHHLRTHDDARALGPRIGGGSRLVVVGGGYVGLEVAASARHLGAEVVVLEREDRALARVAGVELASYLVDHHATHGTRIVTRADVVGLRHDGSSVDGVVLSDGAVLDCDAVLVGVGAVPCEELALAAGIVCAAGVVVDVQARTSAAGVYAVGDMTRRPLHHFEGTHRLESIPSAVEQARQAVASILGLAQPTPEVPWFWSDQYALKVKIAGLVHTADRSVLRGDPASGRFGVFHLRESRVVAVETVDSAPDFMVGKKLIASGAVVLPERVSDLSVPLRDLAA